MKFFTTFLCDNYGFVCGIFLQNAVKAGNRKYGNPLNINF